MRLKCHIIICASTVLYVLGNLSDLGAVTVASERPVSEDSLSTNKRESNLNNGMCPDECMEDQTCTDGVRIKCPKGCKCVCVSGKCKRVTDKAMTSIEFKWGIRSRARRVVRSSKLILSSLKQINDDEVSSDAIFESIKTGISEGNWITEFVKKHLDATGLQMKTVKYVMISALKVIKKIATNIEGVTHVQMVKLRDAIEHLSSTKIVEGEGVDAILQTMQTMRSLAGESSAAKTMLELIKVEFDMNDEELSGLCVGYLKLVKLLINWGSLKPLTRSSLSALTSVVV